MKILKFSAVWCGPCKMMKPVIDKLKTDIDFELISFDTDTDQVETQHYEVSTIPTFIKVDDNGLELNRLVGPHSYQKMKEFVEE